MLVLRYMDNSLEDTKYTRVLVSISRHQGNQDTNLEDFKTPRIPGYQSQGFQDTKDTRIPISRISKHQGHQDSNLEDIKTPRTPGYQPQGYQDTKYTRIPIPRISGHK